MRPVINLLAGQDRIALSGLLGPVGRHAHATAAIVIGVDRPLRFLARGRARESRAALIAPGFEHAVDVQGSALAVFLLPPHLVAADSLAPVTDLPAQHWVSLAQQIERLPDFDEVDRALRRSQPRPLDDRLAAATAQIAARLDENLPIDALAASVRLSPTRLMTLAREQLGCSLRAYRRWLRTFQVARDYAHGASLTTAALDAGFASSAHLSAAAQSHFGIRPSQVLSPANRTRIVTV